MIKRQILFVNLFSLDFISVSHVGVFLSYFWLIEMFSFNCRKIKACLPFVLLQILSVSDFFVSFGLQTLKLTSVLSVDPPLPLCVCRLYNGNTVGQQFGPKCCRGDRIGCGLSFDSDVGPLTVFFTKNGKEVSAF